MGNTVRSFRFREEEWLTRAKVENPKSTGHRTYAFEQANMWKELADSAERAFGDNAV